MRKTFLIALSFLTLSIIVHMTGGGEALALSGSTEKISRAPAIIVERDFEYDQVNFVE